MLLRDWRVGYSQSFEETQRGGDWSCNSTSSQEDAENLFEKWKTSHYDKNKMSALIILYLEWDAYTGQSSCSILKQVTHKIQTTIHYNKPITVC